jgi:hypothetical protein
VKLQITLLDGSITLETDGFEITHAGALALYKSAGPGLHQEITNVFADGQWLRVTRVE